jgi:hypothetical protein
VPVREDLSDIIEVYDWLEENPEYCKWIINNAKELWKEIFSV